jgi:hypothetical protein
VYQSNVLPALKTADEAATGAQPGYGSADLAFGVSHHDWHTELYIQNVTDRRGEVYRYTTCVPEICSLINVIPIKPRLVGLSFGQQF